ncbi:MAG: phytanoyl-CoA dioxygenase family protein [bacterium]|nr:phytanoyl-CoA dioxygenase family protein [bacterium]
MTPEEFSTHCLRIQLDGYSVVPDLLTSEECEEAQRELDRILAEECSLPGAPQDEHNASIQNLFNKARIFERLYQLPHLLKLIRHFLGEDAVLSSVQAHIRFPGAPEQGLHADGSRTGPNRPGAPADKNRRITSHVLGFNVAFCISPFNKKTGATRLVPGSHRYEDITVPPPPVPGETVVEAKRGSAVIFNVSTWHGASAHTGNQTRYAVMTPWRRQWLRPENELGRIVKPDVLERAGPDGLLIFGIGALPPYIDRWAWDIQRGRPKPEWKHLQRE